MGHYRRADIEFQFALAEAFTLCDAYHCSVTTGTDPNRVMFWSGSSFDPVLRARGENCTDANSEPDNLRCWVTGTLPTPGYTYNGAALTWPTLPEVLEEAGVSWRIYQDPNDNFSGAMHGGLAFQGFRNAKPGSSLYRNGMTHWSLEQFATDVRGEKLPRVSWVLPSQLWSEHPNGSSPRHGAALTARLLDALTANPSVWSKTAFFLTFDENDGFFDHVPAPAPPSYNLDGTLAGKATLNLGGHYFSDPGRKHLHPQDTASGAIRPFGLGARVPMYVVSPWSRGGWVNSEVFDHSSVGRFLEKRFRLTIRAISPWHRTVCGDLTSAFDFTSPNEVSFPALPRVDAAMDLAKARRLPLPTPPKESQPRFQEAGSRPSRALPYVLHVDAKMSEGKVSLQLSNEGRAGAVFHVYDRLHLDRIPRRYTVEASLSLADVWDATATDNGAYHLWVYGPNGFVREFKGSLKDAQHSALQLQVRYDPKASTLVLSVGNPLAQRCKLHIKANAYHSGSVWSIQAEPGKRAQLSWKLKDSGHWYDFTVAAANYEFRFAGRMESGTHSISDPQLSLG